MQQPPLPPPPPPLSSPPTSAQTEDDSADDATMTATNNNDNATSHPYNNRPRSSFCHGHNNTTTSRPYNERPRSSFCHGHSNPRHDGAYHFFFRRKHGEQHQPRASTGLDEERKGSRGKEERGINKEQEKEEHNDHHRCHDESQLRNDHRGRIQERFGWWLRPSSVSSSPPPPPPPMGTKPAPGATAIAAASSSSTAFVRDEATNFRWKACRFYVSLIGRVVCRSCWMGARQHCIVYYTLPEGASVRAEYDVVFIKFARSTSDRKAGISTP